MKTILIMLFAVTLAFAQGNLEYVTATVANGDSVITVDLGYDLNQSTPDYVTTGNEHRIIGIVFTGTWTNTSFTVSASNASDGTYYDVYADDETQLTITMASNRWIWLDQKNYAGIRYVRFTGAVAEGDARTYWLIKRQY